MFFQIETILWWFPSDFQILPPLRGCAPGQQLSIAVSMGALPAVGQLLSFSCVSKNKSYKTKQAQSWSKLINGINFAEQKTLFCWSFSVFGSRIYQIDVKNSTNLNAANSVLFPQVYQPVFKYFLRDFIIFRFRLTMIRPCGRRNVPTSEIQNFS